MVPFADVSRATIFGFDGHEAILSEWLDDVFEARLTQDSKLTSANR